jgi:hypothetical protein
MLAAKMQIAIAHERAGQQVRFAQNLETVADAQHKLAALRCFDDRFHHWRKSRDRSAPQVIPVRETTGQDNQIVLGDGVVLVPDVFGCYPQVSEREEAILVTIRAWETNDSGFHLGSFSDRSS